MPKHRGPARPAVLLQSLVTRAGHRRPGLVPAGTVLAVGVVAALGAGVLTRHDPGAALRPAQAAPAALVLPPAQTPTEPSQQPVQPPSEQPSEPVQQPSQPPSEQPVAPPAPAPTTEVPAPPVPASRGGGRTALPATPQEYARQLVADRGWAAGQYDCLDSLWTRESGWDVGATNARSGAYGIPQALPGGKMASHGADWRTSWATQVSWGVDYVAQRWGSPCSADAHSRGYGWY